MSPITDGPVDLLIVDDDPYLQQDLKAYFSQLGYRIQLAGTVQQAIELMQNQLFPVTIIDMNLPDRNGIDLLEERNRSDTEGEVIVLTGQATIETAVEAMKRGAVDYLTKPVRLRELEAVVSKAVETFRLKKRNQQLQGILQQKQPTQTRLIGNSAAMQQVDRLIKRTAPTDKAILICGESGTGKELVAEAIHRASQVAETPMIAVNCAALPEQLLESEMFGHEKGAFTGATATKLGLFEIADRGTLFIDEIGELALTLQAKLLRVLEDGTFRRVGSTKLRSAQVRVIAATNRDLQKEVKAGRFREDLYYRINVLTINLPPLRERRADLAVLLKHFAGEDWLIEAGLTDKLQRYDWPGNVRQLKNAVERAKILGENQQLELLNFPDEIVAAVRIPILETQQTLPAGNTSIALAELTRQHIEAVLNAEKNNKAAAARKLGVSRRTLYRLLEKHSLLDEPGTNS